MPNQIYINTDIGIYIAQEDGAGITRLERLSGGAGIDSAGSKSSSPLLKECSKQLTAYYAGSLKRFDLPLRLHGTEFQKKVWHALQKIPYGETRSYGEIAAAIGNPKACRAVGLANNRNPVAIIVPCHRVIGANGALVGYAGGVWIKKYLLELEEKNK